MIMQLWKRVVAEISCVCSAYRRSVFGQIMAAYFIANVIQTVTLCYLYLHWKDILLGVGKCIVILRRRKSDVGRGENRAFLNRWSLKSEVQHEATLLSSSKALLGKIWQLHFSVMCLNIETY